MAPQEPPAEHHRLLCEALDQLIAGDLRRLIVLMPPGSAKSTYASVRFPAYFLGRKGEHSIICASYGEDLANSFGRKVRNLVDSREYQRLFPDVSLMEDSRAKGEWETRSGGSYFACGVGSGITGRRGDLGVIDDPVKGRKEADSELVRETTWQWYKSDFLTRLKPGASQILIQTRWHEDDLAGRILVNEWDGDSGDFEGFDGQSWRVICLPAEARENDPLGRAPGDYLWPDWFTPAYWEETKRTQQAEDIRNWTSLYQQTPRPEEGSFFRRDWFRRYRVGEHPERLTLYGASDYAVTEGDGDYTEHSIGGFDRDEDLWLIDWWSDRATTDVWINEEIRLARRHEPLVWVAEGGVIRRAVEPYLKKKQQQDKCWFRLEWLTSNKDKAANARAFQGLASQGKVWIPMTPWGDALIDQLVAFPAGKYDDKVDVCGLFGRILHQTFAPSMIQSEQSRSMDAYGFDDDDEETWKTA